MRGFWLEEVMAYSEQYPKDTHPLFLTLPGPAAHDVRLLINNGMLELTESGAIADDHQFRVVCIERNGMAVAKLNREFPGMKIVESTVENLLAWQSKVALPPKKDRRLFQARVVNLDFDNALVARRAAGSVVFPVIEVIRKLVKLHAIPQRLRWTLCLTLHGEIPWLEEEAESAQAFMRENLDRDVQFRVHATSALTQEFVERLVAANTIDFRSLRRVEQQRFLMVFVPKKIAHVVRTSGWRVVTKHNVRYGTRPNAPMTAWVLEFVPVASPIFTPDAGYREALRGIFSTFTNIASDGSLGKA
jgi:hypothetical protein